MKQNNTEQKPLQTPLQDKGNGHTPGEWEVIGGDSNSRYIHANKPDGTLGKIVATAHGENIEETKANAKLIASAPQLKAENEKVKRLLHDLTPGGSEFYNDPEYCAKWIREAREQNHYSLTGTIKTLKADNQKKEDTIKELKTQLKAMYDMAEQMGMIMTSDQWTGKFRSYFNPIMTKTETLL